MLEICLPLLLLAGSIPDGQDFAPYHTDFCMTALQLEKLWLLPSSLSPQPHKISEVIGYVTVTGVFVGSLACYLMEGGARLVTLHFLVRTHSSCSFSFRIWDAFAMASVDPRCFSFHFHFRLCGQ